MNTPTRANLLPTAAVVSLLVLLLGAASLFTLGLSRSRAAAALDRQTRLDETRSTALEAQIHFKTQVQEWKNILLRGASPDDYARHFAAFEKNEAFVQSGLASAQTGLRALGLDSLGLDELAASHRTLGTDYRAALSGWTRAEPSGAFAVDKAVRGRDRKIGEDIDAFAAKVDGLARDEWRAAGEAAAALHAALRKGVLVIGALAVVASLWLVFAAGRASRA